MTAEFMRRILVASVMLSAACGRESTTAPTSPAYSLTGRVSDTADHPLTLARVEVLNGPQHGAIAVTDNEGGFAFGPIFTSSFMLRASKEGYRDESHLILTAQSDGFFTLVRLGPDLRGNYEVTFASDAACTSLPATARTRTYSLSLGSSQSGPTGASIYFGTLSGAEFGRSPLPGYPMWNVVNVIVSDDVAEISFSDPEIWEHLTPETDLQIIGGGRGAAYADGAQWSFGGTFAYCPAAELDDYPECRVPPIICQSRNHHITLTRMR